MISFTQRFAVASLVAFAACTAAAAQLTESRNVAEFTSLSLSAPIEVQLAQGERDSLELRGDEKALAEIESVVEDRTLHLRLKNRSYRDWNFKVVAVVTMRKVSALAIAGSGDIATGALRGDMMKLSVSGSGNLRIGELAAQSTDIAIRGSGDVSIAGKADSVTASIAGSGDIHAARLQAARVKMTVAGSGNATVWVKDALKVSVAGSGDVRYYGDPAVEKSSVGSGSVKRLGAAPG